MIELREEINAKKKPYGHYEIKIVTKSGIVRKTMGGVVDSFLYQYWKLVNAMVHAQDPSMRMLDGSTDTSYPTGTHSEMNGGAGGYMGIVIGGGNTPVSIDDELMDSIIDHGTGAGQMEFGNCTRQIENNLRDAHFTRTFSNNSGSPIDVNEVGLTISTGNEGKGSCALILRDVFGSTATVNDGESIIVDYTFGWNVGTRNIKAFSSWWSDGIDDTWYNLGGGTSQFTADSLDRMSTSFNEDDDRDSVIVGTGTTAPAFDDYDLENLIPHGNGSGELDYGATSASLSLDAGNDNVKWTWERTFNNNSGADITINEIGIIISSQGSFDNKIPMLFFRGVFGSPPTIVAGTSRTVKVVFDYTV